MNNKSEKIEANSSKKYSSKDLLDKIKQYPSKYLFHISLSLFFSGLVIIILFLIILYASNYRPAWNSIDLEKTSWVGTFIGGIVAPLWSLAGIILFYVIYVKQQQEMHLQVKNAEETNWLYRFQSIENNFFNLINYQQYILDNIEYTIIDTNAKGELTKTTLKGVEFFKYAQECMQALYDFLSIDDESKIENESQNGLLLYFTNLDLFYKNRPSVDQSKERARYVYKFFFNKFHEQVGHYFRNLYHILKYLQKNEVILNKLDNKKQYSAFVQAQMSTSQLFLTVYNGYLYTNAKDIINSFELVENLAIDDLLDEKHSEDYPCMKKRRGDLLTQV